MSPRKRFPRLAFFGAALLVATVGGAIMGLPQTILVAVLVIGSILLVSMALWQHANAHATGSEWWQDDSYSGWRGSF
jgi:hypothetical protein